MSSADAGDTLRGKPADIWALGCTYYKLLFGKHPFEGQYLSSNGQKDLEHRIVHAEYSRVTSVDFPPLESGAQLPEDFRDIIRKMLDKDPQTRITAKQLLKHPHLLDSASASSLHRVARVSSTVQKFKHKVTDALLKKVHRKEKVNVTIIPKQPKKQ